MDAILGRSTRAEDGRKCCMLFPLFSDFFVCTFLLKNFSVLKALEVRFPGKFFINHNSKIFGIFCSHVGRGLRGYLSKNGSRICSINLEAMQVKEIGL